MLYKQLAQEEGEEWEAPEEPALLYLCTLAFDTLRASPLHPSTEILGQWHLVTRVTALKRW